MKFVKIILNITNFFFILYWSVINTAQWVVKLNLILTIIRLLFCQKDYEHEYSLWTSFTDVGKMLSLCRPGFWIPYFLSVLRNSNRGSLLQKYLLASRMAEYTVLQQQLYPLTSVLQVKWTQNTNAPLKYRVSQKNALIENWFKHTN